jgi:hypothetical protein
VAKTLNVIDNKVCSKNRGEISSEVSFRFGKFSCLFTCCFAILFRPNISLRGNPTNNYMGRTVPWIFFEQCRLSGASRMNMYGNVKCFIWHFHKYICVKRTDTNNNDFDKLYLFFSYLFLSGFLNELFFFSFRRRWRGTLLNWSCCRLPERYWN